MLAFYTTFVMSVGHVTAIVKQPECFHRRWPLAEDKSNGWVANFES